MLPNLMAIALQMVAPTQMAHADQLNGQFVSCLFGESRQARERSEPTERFAGELESACRAEEMALRVAMRRILVQRGFARTARAKVDHVIQQSRKAVAVAYDRANGQNELR